jgi:hypothetical protein
MKTYWGSGGTAPEVLYGNALVLILYAYPSSETCYRCQISVSGCGMILYGD